jgi:hypothetical protein
MKSRPGTGWKQKQNRSNNRSLAFVPLAIHPRIHRLFRPIGFSIKTAFWMRLETKAFNEGFGARI